MATMCSNTVVYGGRINQNSLWKISHDYKGWQFQGGGRFSARLISTENESLLHAFNKETLCLFVTDSCKQENFCGRSYGRCICMNFKSKFKFKFRIWICCVFVWIWHSGEFLIESRKCEWKSLWHIKIPVCHSYFTHMAQQYSDGCFQRGSRIKHEVTLDYSGR